MKYDKNTLFYTFLLNFKIYMKRANQTDILDLVQRTDLVLWTVNSSAEDLFI